jgi:LCP family protein required for cell wall assembly
MPQQFKRKFQKFLPYIKVAFLALFFLFVLNSLSKILSPIYKFAVDNRLTTPFFKSLLFDENAPVKNYKGKTNVVILGISGGTHEGADLTDTIIFLSIDIKKKDALMLSIPRDIWSATLKDKINSAYHYGEEKQRGGGLLLSKAIVEEIVGQPLHYGVLIDFNGFKKMVDFVGGVQIDVEVAFTDNFYPVPGRESDLCNGDPSFSCRYEKLVFEKGRQEMDGERVLKYVRSRQGEGNEGTDFGRSRRQQQVILALKDKFLSSSFWQNPKKIKELLNLVNQVVTTDMNWSEKILIGKSLFSQKDGNIKRLSLDTGDEKKGEKGYLINPPSWQYNGAWVLLPRSGDYEEIHEYIACNLENSNCSSR